jgi:hypothetical protein
LRVLFTNEGLGAYQQPTYGRTIIVERVFGKQAASPSKYSLKGLLGANREHVGCFLIKK